MLKIKKTTGGLAALAAALLLAACGGSGGGGTTDSGSGSGTPTSPTPPAPTSAEARVAQALKDGSAAGLQSEHRATLLAQASAISQRLTTRPAAVLGSLYSAGGKALDLTLNHSSDSITISPISRVEAMPYIVSDNGSGMAALVEVGPGRAMAYGADVLAWMAGSTREQQHLPLFTRAFTWTVTGAAEGSLPATLKYAVAGYNSATVKSFITRLGKTAQDTACTIATDNSCWQGADLLVFGAGVADDGRLQARVASYLAAGKPVIYMHPNWINSDPGRAVLAAMKMEMGGYPGNYFAPSAGVAVGAGRTAAQSLANASSLQALSDTLAMLGNDALQLDFSANTAPTDAITRVHNELASYQSRGVNVFQTPGLELYGLLTLYADLLRPSISYGSIDKAAAPATFLRTYASDSWVVYNRSTTTTATAGQGDYMPAAAQALAVASDWEDIEVTIAQGSGNTLIGRGAVPAKGLQVQVMDAAGAKLGLQTSYLRAWGNPLSDKNYPRPRRPHSFNLPLPAVGSSLDFVSPFGGPLMLSYSGATPGSVVKLRIKGSAKYAHFDFSRGSMSDADIADAVAALKRADFGWQTNKFVGGEIQQTIKYAQSVIGNKDPKAYVVDQLKGVLFDSNHIANGYSNMPMASGVQALCSQFGWTCDGNLHRAPGVQHFVGWIATCGYLCSGNPSDGFAGVDVGWGWAHELGHNTVQRVMHITPDGSNGCVVECDNNILASATMLRGTRVLGTDLGGHTLDYPSLYAAILANRATGGTDAQREAEMTVRLWSQSSQDLMRGVHFQLAFLYTQYRSGLAQPDTDRTLEFLTLLTKGDRLVDKAWDPANKGRYAMGRYADNKISNHELLYVLSSKIIGRDLRKFFAMYGMPLSATALGSVADLGLPVAPLQYYAIPAGKYNQPGTGKWLDIDASSPAYPF
ncbi:ImpA family metalloprotease [Roseateles sp. PN1]|uniref:ImpA family metalloprotease n=1 Tax=Roseateles sp. PN1 TaxID=3137372 RepID=UPI003139A6DC